MEQIGIFIGILVAIATEPLFHTNYVRLVQTHEKSSGEHGGAEPEVGIFRAFISSTGVVHRWNCTPRQTMGCLYRYAFCTQ